VQLGRGRSVSQEDTMKNGCACFVCGKGLNTVMSWARLVTEEPEVLTCEGPWGQDEVVAVRGDQEVSVACPRCGVLNAVGRNCPAAAA
jgi:hypothetical protein